MIMISTGLLVFPGKFALLFLTHTNTGTCYHKMGRNEEAICMFKVSVEGSETGVQQTDKAALSRTYSNMGAIYRKMNLHDKAYEMFAKAKSLIGDEKNVVGDQPVSDVMRSKNLYPAAEYRNKRTLEDLEETFSPTTKEPSKPAMQQQAPHYLLSSSRTKRSLDLSKPINAKVTTSPCSGKRKKSIEQEVNERVVCVREIPVALGKVQEVAMTVEEEESLCQAGGDTTSDSIRMVARAASSRANTIIEDDFREGGRSLQSALLEAQITSSISDINGTLDDEEAQAKMSVDAKALSLLAQDFGGSAADADGGTWRENTQAPLLLPLLPLTASPTVPQLEKQAHVLANVANANFDIQTSVLPSFELSLSPSLQCVSDSNALHVGPRGSCAVTISDELLTEPEPLDENMNPHTDSTPHRRTESSQPRSPSPLGAAVCSQQKIFSPKLVSNVGSNGAVPAQNKSQVSEEELDQPDSSPIRAAVSPVRNHESPQRRAISPITSPRKTVMCSRSNREQITLFSPRSTKVISPRSGSAMYAWLHHDISSEVKSPRANSGNKNGPLSSDKHEDLQKRHTGACGAWVAENMIHEISSSAAVEYTATTAMAPASLPPHFTASTERHTSSTSVNMFSWLHGTLSNSAPASVSATNVLPSVRGVRPQGVKRSEHAEARKSPRPSPHVNPLKLSTSPEASIPSPTKLSDGAQSTRISDAWSSQREEDLSKLHSGSEVIQGCFWLPELQSGSVLDTCEWSVCDTGNLNDEQASEPTSEDKTLSARPPSESSITLSETPRSLSSTKPRSMSPVLIPEMKDFMNLVCASELATNPDAITSGGEPDTLVRYLF
jgi:tetratricopeptide (TPR) repeat protein